MNLGFVRVEPPVFYGNIPLHTINLSSKSLLKAGTLVLSPPLKRDVRQGSLGMKVGGY